MGIRSDIESIDELVKMRGWSFINETMRNEIVAAAMAIANNSAMSEKEVDFRRGAIWAASQFLELPNRLKVRLENDLRMQELTAKHAAKAAKE